MVNMESVSKTTSGQKRPFKATLSRNAITDKNPNKLLKTTSKVEPSDTTRNISALSENQSEKEATPIFIGENEIKNDAVPTTTPFHEEYERPAL